MADDVVPLLWVPILAYTVWCWAGRSARARSWAGNPTVHGLVLGVAPGLGLFLFSAWLTKVFGDVAAPVVAPLALLGGLVFLFAFVTPQWWGPAWFRRMSELERVDVHNPTSAAGISMIAGAGPGPSVNKASRAFGSFAQLVGSWRGGYVYDPDTRERAHGVARWGTVEGTVTLYAEGLTFAATGAEDVLREQETVLMLPAEQITDVRVVPPRAGADGVPRRGFWHRSWFSRLVVDTGDGAYLLEVDWGKAKQVADQVTTITGRMS